MNEVGGQHTFEIVMWVIGSLFTVFTLLLGVIYRHGERRHDGHDAEIKWFRENYVSKETLERVERTFRDAVDDMVVQRERNHEENRASMHGLQESVKGIHRRIDEEFRYLRSPPKT